MLGNPQSVPSVPASDAGSWEARARASPLMVDRLDLLTRLNRQWGVGKFIVTLGGLPGIPVNVQMCDIERSGFNDTNMKWSR